MSLENYKKFINKLGKITGIKHLQPDQEGYCCLAFDDKIVVHLQYKTSEEYNTSNEDCLLLFAPLGIIDEDKVHDIYPRLLNANHFWQGTDGATLGVHDETREALLSYKLSFEKIDYAKFQTVMENFINRAKRWVSGLNLIHYENKKGLNHSSDMINSPSIEIPQATINKNLDKYKQLIKNIGKTLKLDPLTITEEYCCSLGFDEKVIIHIQYSQLNDYIMLFAQLGKVDKANITDVYPGLLKANLFWQGTCGATIGVDDNTGDAIMCYQAELQLLDDQKFHGLLEGLVNIAELWIDTIEMMQQYNLRIMQDDADKSFNEQEKQALSKNKVIFRLTIQNQQWVLTCYDSGQSAKTIPLKEVEGLSDLLMETSSDVSANMKLFADIRRKITTYENKRLLSSNTTETNSASKKQQQKTATENTRKRLHSVFFNGAGFMEKPSKKRKFNHRAQVLGGVVGGEDVTFSVKLSS